MLSCLSSWCPPPAAQLAPRHQIALGVSTAAHTCVLVVCDADSVFPGACLGGLETYKGKMQLIQLGCALGEDKQQLGEVLFKAL